LRRSAIVPPAAPLRELRPDRAETPARTHFLHRTYLLRQPPAIKSFLAESRFPLPSLPVFPTMGKIERI
jgi:hypothetical protein